MAIWSRFTCPPHCASSCSIPHVKTCLCPKTKIQTHATGASCFLVSPLNHSGTTATRREKPDTCRVETQSTGFEPVQASLTDSWKAPCGGRVVSAAPEFALLIRHANETGVGRRTSPVRLQPSQPTLGFSWKGSTEAPRCIDCSGRYRLGGVQARAHGFWGMGHWGGVSYITTRSQGQGRTKGADTVM